MLDSWWSAVDPWQVQRIANAWKLCLTQSSQRIAQLGVLSKHLSKGQFKQSGGAPKRSLLSNTHENVGEPCEWIRISGSFWATPSGAAMKGKPVKQSHTSTAMAIQGLRGEQTQHADTDALLSSSCILSIYAWLLNGVGIWPAKSIIWPNNLIVAELCWPTNLGRLQLLDLHLVKMGSWVHLRIGIDH